VKQPRSDLCATGTRAPATSPALRGGRRSAAPPSRDTCTAGRTERAISSRWCTTESSTASMAAYAEGAGHLAETPTWGKARTRGRRRGPRPCRAPPERYQYDLDLRDITEVWAGAAASSLPWLLDSGRAGPPLIKDPALSEFSGQVSDLGRGDGGRSTRPSTRRCRRPVLFRRPLSAVFSSRGRGGFFKTASCPPCDTSSADTSRSPAAKKAGKAHDERRPFRGSTRKSSPPRRLGEPSAVGKGVS